MNAGQSWLPLLGEPTNGLGIPSDPELLNPATTMPTVPFEYRVDSQPGVRRQRQLLHPERVWQCPHARDLVRRRGRAAEVRLHRFHARAQAFTTNQQDPVDFGGGGGFGGGASNLKVIYQWAASSTNDQAINATMTVDDNLSTIPNSVSSTADPYSGDVYVAWTSIDVNTSIPITPFNPNRTKLVVSSDGGNNFSPLTITDATPDERRQGNFTGEHDTTPAITVSQGRAPSESGQSGDSGIPGGQVAVGWADFGTNQVQVMANTVSAGQDYSFGGVSGDDPLRDLSLRGDGVPGAGLDHNHRRPEYPRRHGQHRRQQRREPGPGAGGPQRRHVHAAAEPDH